MCNGQAAKRMVCTLCALARLPTTARVCPSLGMKDLLAQYPNQVRFVYRHFPLGSIHANAQKAAEAAECAGEQGKFWEMHDLLFANQQAQQPANLEAYAQQLDVNLKQFNACLTSGKMADVVQQDVSDGKKYGVLGTPTFFVNRQMVHNASEIEQAVQQALNTPE